MKLNGLWEGILKWVVDGYEAISGCGLGQVMLAAHIFEKSAKVNLDERMGHSVTYQAYNSANSPP